MAATALETALAALFTAIAAATAAEVIRNADRPEKVGAAGLVVLRDGVQTDSEATMSPLRYHIEHTAEIVLLGEDEDARDALLKEISDALVADRTLSGAVEFLEVLPVSLDDADFDGSAGIPGLLMPVALHYTVAGSPAG